MTSLASIAVHSPSGAAWEFLILFAVVIVGPPLMQRARIPGIIGLLVGGFVIGPHGLDLIGAGNTTVPELGQLGLLYLMFVAGVELDLGLVRVHRNSVVGFGAITFVVPMGLGVAVGLGLGWALPASLLLGSLLSSHTLLLYPAARGAGLSADRGVATAVGATVLTDTASLIVLAAVSSSELAGGSTASIAAQIVIGLLVLVAFTLGLLPRLARLAFRYLGTDRIVRYLLAVACFLAAAVLADSFGIEGIVGAFFAGLALNRLVPNEGPLMDRIDFFGSAVFVPIFLVSVGMLLDPAVMVSGEALKLAGLFILASIGGKAIASAIGRVAFGYSGPQAELMLGLTVPQAAAALAATIVGFDIGLFDQAVVNAVLVLILASIVVGTLLVERAVRRVPSPGVEDRLGHRILVTLEDPTQAPLAFAIAARIAAPDSGVVHGLLSSPPAEARSRQELLSELSAAAFAADLDAEPQLLVHESLPEGVVNAAIAERASLVLVGQRPAAASAFGTAGEAVAAGAPVPVAILIGAADKVRRVRFAPNGDSSASKLAAELAARLGADGGAAVGELLDGELCVMPAASWGLLADPPEPPPGTAVLIVPQT
ncbi:MAG TPA: cation:proton antiporter [Solirubrobacterales bacterium]|nr:cation:proton antiporter [Solirubrobacterales bacterium]